MYQYESDHLKVMQAIAPECMVLLKKDGSFPIAKPGKVALYGSGARKTIKGGTGSGDVNVRSFATIEQGLEAAGFKITTKDWLDAYDCTHEDARKAFLDGIKQKAAALGIPALFIGMGATMPEPEYEISLESEADLAIYVLSRVSGEGSDRKAIKGDILLTDTEIRDILELNQKFPRFMLVLNVGGYVDLSPVASVGNILLLSQLGSVTGNAFADVLLGNTYPSGKLASTWTAWNDYCTVGSFGEEDDTVYREGIYVGYRYFDSAGIDVLYPFGHGLGYTDFRLSPANVEVDATKVSVKVTVSNVGNHPGKEVVQAYVSLPTGKLDQPYQQLAAFAKTKKLLPGQEETVSLSFQMEDLASYDEDSSAMILEAGQYVLRIGNSSRNCEPAAVIELSETVTTKSVGRYCGTPDFQDWKPNTASTPVSDSYLKKIRIQPDAFSLESAKDMPDLSEEIAVVKAMSNEELAYLCCGDFSDGKDEQSFVGSAASHVLGAAGETTNKIQGLPFLTMADGPAGLRLHPLYGVDEEGSYPIGSTIPAAFADFMDENIRKAMGYSSEEDYAHRRGEIKEQYCTAIPIGTAVAQSWNVKVAEACGDVVGSEMERFGVQLWLAPAMNIQRSPLCGRNFEYASEDPLVTGIISAGIVRGVQAHPGCGAVIKHFCCNNQETNRFRNNSSVSLRALRDIYLKGFEMCIRLSNPAAVMTSYNLLNGIHTSENKELIAGILRGDWQYDGLVISDWLIRLAATQSKYPNASSWKSVKAGNDLIMPGGASDYNEILDALQQGDLLREELEMCAARIVRTVKKFC